jgi:hypothetical protein
MLCLVHELDPGGVNSLLLRGMLTVSINFFSELELPNEKRSQGMQEFVFSLIVANHIHVRSCVPQEKF